MVNGSRPIKKVISYAFKVNVAIGKKVLLIIFGIFLSLVLIEAGLRIGEFIYLSSREYRNRISMMQNGVCRIISLGCSNTALGGKYSYPSQLEGILNQKKLGIKFSVLNLGCPGMHSGSIVAELEHNLDKYKPDIVTVMMGINDIGNDIPYRYVPDNKMIQFLKSFKIYKMARILWLRVMNKAKENGIYGYKSSKTIYSSTIDRGDMLKNTIANDPKNAWAYFELGLWYRDLKQTDKARQMLEKALELDPENKFISRWTRMMLGFTEHKENWAVAESRFKQIIDADPRNPWGYILLGWWYRLVEKYDEFEETYRKAIEINPTNIFPYLELGRFYKSRGDYGKAREVFEKAVVAFNKAIERDSGQAWPYMEMGWWYNDEQDINNSEKRLKRIIETEPGDGWAYVELMKLYREEGKYDKVLEIFKKATDMDKKNVWVYYELSKSFKEQGQYDKAAEMIQQGLEVNSVKDSLYSGLAMCYEELGNHKLAEEYLIKAENLRLKNYNPMTRYNYQKLKEIVSKRKIKLVCIQYPMRYLWLLKRLFDDKEGIVFVDNEKTFKEAVRQGKYEDFFLNSFAGDFGHCTPKGNRIIAQNVADAIEKAYFK